MVHVVQADADDLARAGDAGSKADGGIYDRGGSGIGFFPFGQTCYSIATKEGLVPIGTKSRGVDATTISELKARFFLSRIAKADEFHGGRRKQKDTDAVGCEVATATNETTHDFC